MTKEHEKEYDNLEFDLIYKMRIGVLTMWEVAKIIDVWLTERGY